MNKNNSKKNRGPVVPRQALCADAAEHESSLGFYYLAIHFEQGVDEKVDRAAGRLGIDHQISAFGQLETIRRIMAEVIISQLWIFPRFADIHRYPASIGEKFGPAVVALDRALFFIGWNRRTNGEARRYSNAARQSNKIGMEIGAVPGSSVACIKRVAAPPADA